MLEQKFYDKADMIIEEHGAQPQFLIPIIHNLYNGFLKGKEHKLLHNR
jgi:hypothetical protein